MKAFGGKLKAARIAKGLSQEQLSILAEMSLSQIGRIERGEINTTISTIYRLSETLKIASAELMP